MFVASHSGNPEDLMTVGVELVETTIRASVSGRHSIIAIALSGVMTIQAVARASAVAQSGAMTVVAVVVVIDGCPVAGLMVWPMRPYGVSR